MQNIISTLDLTSVPHQIARPLIVNFKRLLKQEDNFLPFDGYSLDFLAFKGYLTKQFPIKNYRATLHIYTMQQCAVITRPTAIAIYMAF